MVTAITPAGPGAVF
ncbi:hypothetical protein [Candidatus Methylomicrobium oryzae]